MGKGHCMVVIQICDKCGSGICIVEQLLFLIVPNSSQLSQGFLHPVMEHTIVCLTYY